MKKAFVLSALAFAAISCEKAIDYQLNQEPAKFAIDAHIIPGTPISAFVSVSEFVLNNQEPAPPKNATVLLYEDGNIVDTLYFNGMEDPFDPGWGYYSYEPFRGTYVPQTGHLYRLEASKEGITTAYGEGYTPNPVALDEVDFDSERMTLDVSFTDHKTEGDYYRIKAYLKQYGYKSPIWMSTYDPFVEYFYADDDELVFGGGNNAKSGMAAFLSDDAFNGKSRTVRFTDVGSWYYFDENRRDTLIVELSRVTRDLYLHERSKSANLNSDGNPFAEPVPVYSNVTNGYGIVTGIATDSAMIEF